uniref:Uncharacterized protein n=1 Tax=Ditylenchus dipsaci TaxID=166011 RepID=A0A915DX57_9BILA
MTDPYRCLRCSTVSIAVYNIIYCLIQFGVLGWQVQAVKGLQWEYENRQLPATGGIDAYQARFPGLYAIYTETPERRRINAMYAIVLICLFLSIVHLMTTVAMLYGAIKRMPNWIIPWFFTCAPLVIMCTAYSVLWWSGDVFNEQLTMSVAEFVGSLAVNGVCFIVVIMYYLRLTGRLSSDKPGSARSTTYIPGAMVGGTAFNLQKKMRRRERDRDRNPAAALRQGYNYPTGRSAGMASLRQRSRQTPTGDMSLENQRSQSMLDMLPLGACAQNMESYVPPLPDKPILCPRHLLVISRATLALVALL